MAPPVWRYAASFAGWAAICRSADNDLWQSSDGGATFAKIGHEAGLPPATIHDIQINPTTNRTVLFTYGRGAFELAR